MVTQVILLYIDSSPYCYWYSDLVITALKQENQRLADSLEIEKKERSQGSAPYCTCLLIYCLALSLDGNTSYSAI